MKTVEQRLAETIDKLVKLTRPSISSSRFGEWNELVDELRHLQGLPHRCEKVDELDEQRIRWLQDIVDALGIPDNGFPYHFPQQVFEDLAGRIRAMREDLRVAREELARQGRLPL